VREALLNKLKSESPAGQIVLVVGAALLIGALIVGAWLLFFRPSYAVLFKDLRPADAAAVVAELEKQKAPYRLADGGATILAPAKTVDAARLELMSAELPLKGAVGFELFNKSDMGLTEFAQRINYQRALQGELARTIMAMEAVETARVHLSLSEPTIFRDDRRAPKASVTIATRPGKALSPGAVRGVRRLVAAAVPDLEAADVVVLDERGELAGQEATPAAAAGRGHPIEQYYAARLNEALGGLYPLGGVEVTIAGGPTAELDPALLDSWTPESRRFPLNVELSLTAPLTARLQQEVQALAAEAIGASGAVEDLITVSSGETIWSAPDAASAVAAPVQTPEPAARAPRAVSASQLWLLLLAPVLAGLLWAAWALHRRTGAPKRLSEQERDRYSEKFKLLLDQTDAA